MARKQMNSKQAAGWLWLALIIGLIFAVTVAAMTDQWWWSTVGLLGGAALAGWVTQRPARRVRFRGFGVRSRPAGCARTCPMGPASHHVAKVIRRATPSAR